MKAMETLKSAAAGIAEKVTGEEPKLLQEVIKLVQGMPGGLSGLMKEFENRGLGQVASSLTGKTPAQPVTPEQIREGFGSDRINLLATRAGLDPKVVAEKLTSILPKVVEQLSAAGAAAAR